MKTLRILLAVLVSMAIAACGGGGGGGSPAPSTYTISGTITGATSVTVALAGAATASTTTDASGNYSFAGLANGSYTVAPSKTGFSFSPASKAVAVSGANVSAQDFVATALAAGASTYSISGSTGIAGATVDLGAAVGSTTAGAGGAYTLSGLVAGSYTVTPSLSGYTFSPANAAVTISTANATGVNFTPTAIPVPHSISGNVSGATGVTITVTGPATATATTDASGNYTVTGLVDGAYTVTPAKTGYTFSPNSASVTLAGANGNAPSFTGVANASVQAVVSGAVTGAWVEGVTITMSGGASGATTTNASGNYSFTLASGASYTFTPSLPGYTFASASQTISITAGSSTAVTVPNMVASSAVASSSVSGTFIYAGSKTGRTMIRLVNSTCTASCQTLAFTSLASAPSATGTPFVIRGVQPGSYLIRSYIDIVDNGAGNASNPGVTSAAFTVVAGANNNLGNLTINDPATAPTPVTPTVKYVGPSNGAAFVIYSVPVTANGREVATSYKIYTGTDTAASNGAVSSFAAAGPNNSMHIVNGLSNVATYFKISAVVGVGASAVESAASAVFGPVTVGATTGANTLTGTVTFPGAAGPMVVGAYSDTGGVYFTTIANPVSPQAFSIAGIPNGTYYHFAVIDRNNNGLIDTGDLKNTEGGNSFVTFSGTGLANNLDLTPYAVNAAAVVTTNHYFDGTQATPYHGYNLQLGTNNGAKRVVKSVLYSGPNVAVPFDMQVESGNTSWVSLNTTSPAVGDAYKYQVTYSDGTSEVLSASVSGVITTAQMATGLTVNSTVAPATATVPQFKWAAPAAPLSSYGYRVNVNQAGWWYPQNAPLTSNTFSALYNADGSAAMAALTVGTTYNWQVIVRDAATGNTGSTAAYYTP